jgi:hypothetical protein
MPLLLLHALNIFFLVFHTGLILFNSLGWAFRRTRRWNLVTLGATGFSWFVMGFWYGIGYCACTDWHWQVRRALGYRDDADTYVGFLFESFTPWHPSRELLDGVSGSVFALSVLLSVWLNVRDARAAREAALTTHEDFGNPGAVRSR